MFFFSPGYRWQHLRGCLGFLQAWHVVRYQCTESVKTSKDFQNHQVSGSVGQNDKKYENYSFLSWLKIIFRIRHLFCQVLGLSQELGCFPHELHEVHHQPSFPPLPLHGSVCATRDAAVWRKVCTEIRNYQPISVNSIIQGWIFGCVSSSACCKLNWSLLSGVFGDKEMIRPVENNSASSSSSFLLFSLGHIWPPSLSAFLFRFIFEDYTPTNFDTFPAAIMTVFQVWLLQIPLILPALHDTLHPGIFLTPGAD